MLLTRLPLKATYAISAARSAVPGKACIATWDVTTNRNEVIVHPTVLLNTHPSKRLENSYNSYTSMVDLVHVSDNSPKDPGT